MEVDYTYTTIILPEFFESKPFMIGEFEKNTNGSIAGNRI